jgi:hypothetical protein
MPQTPLTPLELPPKADLVTPDVVGVHGLAYLEGQSQAHLGFVFPRGTILWIPMDDDTVRRILVALSPRSNKSPS